MYDGRLIASQSVSQRSTFNKDWLSIYIKMYSEIFHSHRCMFQPLDSFKGRCFFSTEWWIGLHLYISHHNFWLINSANEALVKRFTTIRPMTHLVGQQFGAHNSYDWLWCDVIINVNMIWNGNCTHLYYIGHLYITYTIQTMVAITKNEQQRSVFFVCVLLMRLPYATRCSCVNLMACEQHLHRS